MFKIAQSPTSRTTCGICRLGIEKGELRLDANLGSGNFGNHFHPKCFAEKYEEELTKLVNYNYEECEKCGAVNNTITSTNTGENEVMLCDYCHAKFVEEV